MTTKKSRPVKLIANTTIIYAFLILALPVIFGACSKDNDNNNSNYDQIKPSGPTPSWGPTLTPQMQTVIETLDSLIPAPLYTMTPQQARQQPTPADAVMRVMQRYQIATPPMNVDTMGKEIPVNGGMIHARVYTPKTGKASYPVIAYYHGGGWVLATIDTYNASAQALAEKTDAIVVSVEYRKGPEYKYPTAHMDAFTAYKWILANASTMKGDSTKVAIAGESAGGNMAVAVSMMARDSSVRMPLHILSVYPVADDDTTTASYQTYADAHPLSKPLMQWFFDYYLSGASETNQQWISLVDADLSGLPPTTIIAAEIDPLQTEGKELADKLQSLNIPTTYKLYTGVTHEFFGMATVIPEAAEAQDLAASALKNALK